MAEKKSLNNRLLRWSLHLQGFDYVIKHRSGKLNVDGDALSRFPVTPGVEMDDNIERHCLALSRVNRNGETKDFLDRKNLAESQKGDYHFGKIYRMISKPKGCKDFDLYNTYVIDKGILYKKSESQ
jgi:hypothetical protein